MHLRATLSPRAALLLAACLLSPAAAGAQVVSMSPVPGEPQAPTISVYATAEALLAPTRAVVYLTVTGTDTSAAAAVREAAAMRERVQAALRPLGFAPDRVQPWAMAMGPPPEVRGRPRVNTFPAEQAALQGLRVTVEPIRQLDAVLVALAGAGVTEVRHVLLEGAEDPAARDAATRQAVQSARAQAESMARAAGVRLGPLQTLAVYPDYAETSSSRMQSMMGFERGTVLVPSEPRMRVTVLAAWRIADR